MPYEYDPYLERYLKEFQDNPRSRIFAPLAEAYRKSGLVDEAIDICKEGLQYHPNFISGMVALARAYLDKGLYTATIRELEKVVSEAPDNYLAQKLLAQSYLLVGDNNNALKAYKMVLYLNPKDIESKTVVSKIESKNQDLLDESVEEIMEDVLEDIQEDAPLLPFKDDEYDYRNSDLDEHRVEELQNTGFEEKNASLAFKSINKDLDDEPEQILTNISTMTMGELLASQGHKEKALEVYKKIFEQNPEQLLIKQKIEDLEQDLGINFYGQETDENSTKDKPETTHDDYSMNITEEPCKINFVDQNLKESTASKTEPESKLDLENEIKSDLESDLENELDNEWLFNDPSENIKVLKLKSILNKVRLYKMSLRKNPS